MTHYPGTERRYSRHLNGLLFLMIKLVYLGTMCTHIYNIQALQGIHQALHQCWLVGIYSADSSCKLRSTCVIHCSLGRIMKANQGRQCLFFLLSSSVFIFLVFSPLLLCYSSFCQECICELFNTLTFTMVIAS